MNGLGTRGIAVLAMLAAAALVHPVHAQSRPDSRMMTCAAVRSLVQRQGAVVIGTGATIYDRYVASGRFCAPTQFPDNAFLATADSPHCLAGYVCRENTLPPYE